MCTEIVGLIVLIYEPKWFILPKLYVNFFQVFYPYYYFIKNMIRSNKIRLQFKKRTCTHFSTRTNEIIFFFIFISLKFKRKDNWYLKKKLIVTLNYMYLFRAQFDQSLVLPDFKLPNNSDHHFKSGMCFKIKRVTDKF